MSATQSLKLLLTVDGSPHSDAAIDLLASIRWPAGTSVHVLAVVPELWSPHDLTVDEAPVVLDTLTRLRTRNYAAARQLLARVAGRLRHGAGERPGSLALETEVREGRAAEMILERAAALSADLIAIGASGFSAPREFRLGSTAQKVTQHAGCSVLVARPSAHTELRRVILAVDGSPESRRAVEWVRTLALPDDAELTVIGVAEAVSEFGADATSLATDTSSADLAHVQRTLLHIAEAHVGATVDGLHGSAAQVRPVVCAGQPAAELVRHAQDVDADLLVIGARGQTRAEPFQLGGVAEKIIRFAPCSVLVAR